MVTCAQIKAGRAMLALSQRQLAQEAGIAVATLNNIERGVQKDPKASTMNAIQQTLESHGVVFTHTLEGAGVLLRKNAHKDLDATILLIDDNKSDRLIYKNWLGRNTHKKYQIIEADGARTGYDAFLKYNPDCIVLDFKMPGTDGFQLLAEMRKDHLPLPPVVLLTGLHNDLLRENAEKQGALACLNKRNVTKEGLHEVVERMLT